MIENTSRGMAASRKKKVPLDEKSVCHNHSEKALLIEGSPSLWS